MATQSKKPDSVRLERRPTAVRFTVAVASGIERAREQIQAERSGEVVDTSSTIRVLVAEALAARKIDVNSGNNKG